MTAYLSSNSSSVMSGGSSAQRALINRQHCIFLDSFPAGVEVIDLQVNCTFCHLPVCV